jgi:hypothetical protein
LIFEPGGVAVLGYVFFLCFREAVAEFWRVWLMSICLLRIRFEHDNINQPAIVVGRKPGPSDRML